jgi:hypothetical protein
MVYPRKWTELNILFVLRDTLRRTVHQGNISCQFIPPPAENCEKQALLGEGGGGEIFRTEFFLPFSVRPRLVPREHIYVQGTWIFQRAPSLISISCEEEELAATPRAPVRLLSASILYSPPSFYLHFLDSPCKLGRWGDCCGWQFRHGIFY